MPQSSENIQPQVIDGIEFYVSNDGAESGMSIRGLAKFVGVSKTTVSNLINKLEKPADTTESSSPSNLNTSNMPEWLEPFVGTEFLLSTNGAKVIPSTLCESIIFYYAYDSKDVSADVQSQARLAHRKFAQYGLHKFILQASGFVERSDISAMKNLLTEVLGEIKDLKSFKEDGIKFRSIRQSTMQMPGLDEMLDELGSEEYQERLLIEQADSKDDEDSDEQLSVAGWLNKKGITLSRHNYLALSKSVAANFKAATRKEPQKKHFRNKDGTTTYNVFVYEPQFFPILQMCLEELLRRS